MDFRFSTRASNVMSVCAFVMTILAILIPSDRLFAEYDTCKSGRKIVTRLGARTEPKAPLRLPSSSVNSAGLVDTKYMRIQLQVLEPEVTGWHLTLSDPTGSLLHTITSDSFKHTKTIWSIPFPGKEVLYRVFPENLSVNPKLIIKTLIEIPYGPDEKDRHYSTKSNNADWLSVTDSRLDTAFRELSQSVGLLVAGRGAASWLCSGSIIAPRLFLTNWHCGGTEQGGMKNTEFWDKGICESTIINLNWKEPATTKEATKEALSNADLFQMLATRREFSCEHVEFIDSNLDIAILRIEPLYSRDAPRPLSLSKEVVTSDQLILIHHPLGLPKKASLDRCKIVRILDQEFTHSCDSEGGSSGAPMLDKNGRIAGIHVSGFENDNNGNCDNYNKAILTTAILDAIGKHKKGKAILDMLRPFNRHWNN